MIKNILLFILFCSYNTILFAQKDKEPYNADNYLRKLDSLNKVAIGKPYPDFEYAGDDGIVYSNKTMLGKKYYINFWFEACHPCMEEMNSLIILNAKLKNTKNVFISFTFDPPSTIKRVREERKLDFIIIPVSRNECYRLNFNSGFPKHIVVDEKGNTEYISSFFKSNEEVIKEIISILTNKSTIQ